MNSAVIKSLQIYLLARELTVFHDLLFDTLVAHLGPFRFIRRTFPLVSAGQGRDLPHYACL